MKRDFDIDGAQALNFKGFTFPKYEGRLTDDEYKSRQTYYAFWGGKYMTAVAIRHIVSTAIDRRQLKDMAA